MGLGSDFALLLQIALKTKKLKGKVNLTTGEIAKELEISQQTISRKLRDLEKKGYIGREANTLGMTISITELGAAELKHHYLLLDKVFHGNDILQLKGKISSGLGEGKYYLSLHQYYRQITAQLGFSPFQGTLNLFVDENMIDKFLLNQKKTKINGFVTPERSYGAIDCYAVKIKIANANKFIQGAVIVPQRSNHQKNIVEIIAPLELRKEFKLKDDDEVVLII